MLLVKSNEGTEQKKGLNRTKSVRSTWANVLRGSTRGEQSHIWNAGEGPRRRAIYTGPMLSGKAVRAKQEICADVFDCFQASSFPVSAMFVHCHCMIFNSNL